MKRFQSISPIDFLWLLPFFLFSLGYFLPSFFLEDHLVDVPHVVGMQLPAALELARQRRLSVQLVAEREQGDLPPGTVIAQSPGAQRQLRPSQPIMVTISKQPPPVRALDALGMKKAEIHAWATKHQVRATMYWVESSQQQGSCIGQYPSPQTPLLDRAMIVYLSAGIQPLYVMPNYKNQSIDEVLSVLAARTIKPTLVHTNREESHRCNACAVIDQRPLAGSIIDLKKELPVQLQLACNG